MPGKGVTTKFGQYTLGQLTQMLDQSSPASCLHTAQTWDSTGKLLHEQAHHLERKLRSLDSSWSGTAATDYQAMMTDLAGGIRKVGDIAFQIRNLTYDALDALNTAIAQMPAPVSVPAVSPATVALATTPLQLTAGMSPQAAALAQQQHDAAVQAVAAQQQAIAAATSAEAKAVAIMQALAGSYVNAENGVPPSATGTTPTVPATGGTMPAGATPVDGTSPFLTLAGLSSLNVFSGAQTTAAVTSGVSDSALSGQSSSLFGNMFTIGLAAAAAAGASVAGLVARQNSQKSGSALPGGANLAAAGAGGGVVGGAVMGGAGGPGSTSLSAADATQAANLAGDNAAGSAAGSAASSESMMPMMPMGGTGMGAGAGAGGTRRIPPWLVEHEDVWGTSIPAAPPLIGDA
jgi:hypothetical protein